jgi:Spy/CpxP family protein refolding chaperone
MKTLNSSVFLVALGLAFGVTASAQKPDHPPSPEERLARMKADLGLSEAQVAKIKPALEANAARGKALHDDASLSEEQKKEKFHEIRKAGADAIMAELTPEQKKKFEERLKQHRKDGPPGGPGGGPKGGGKPGAKSE